MNTILEGYVKHRDGKKWKKRYCVLCSPSKSLSVLHLYFGKSIDDFNAAFRSSQSSNALSTAVSGPSSTASTTSTTSTCNSGSRPTVNVFHSLTTRSNYYCNLPHPQSHAVYVADPVTEMCNHAERAVVHDLEVAAGRVRGLGCPAPLDAVTGFETGCHLSGESNVLLLIGWKTVHPVALPSVDEMFNWAEVLERALIDSNYHVTLCRVGSPAENTSASSCVAGVGNSGCSGVGGLNSGGGISSSSTSSSASNILTTSTVVGGGVSGGCANSSRIQVGLQASLHVQQWRLCLIGEPSAGCQFIAQWRLDALDAAYTMDCSSNSSAFSNFGGNAFDSVGGQNFLGFTPPSSHGATSTLSTCYQNDDRFFLEANRAAGKGLIGNYVFQVDGKRLGQLAHAIDELMLRRFLALTAPPGTVVLPSSNVDDDSLHIRKSSAIDIRSKNEDGKPLFCASFSLSPSTGVGGSGADGRGIFGSSSPRGSRGAFAPSSLPTRGDGVSAITTSATAVAEEIPMIPHHSSSASSSRSKKSGHRQLFGAQTLGRSDAIKIPTRRFTTALSKVTVDGGSSVRGRSSSKAGSIEGSAEGSSSDASSTKPQPPLYFPSVMVGAGIITSLVPAPPPPSQSTRSEVFGAFTVATAPLRPKPKSELPPPLPPPLSHSSPPPTSYRLACERCQRRRRRDYRNSPSVDSASISSEDGIGGGVGGSGEVFAADEDVEQPMFQPMKEIDPLPSFACEAYVLYKQLYRTVRSFHRSFKVPRSGSLDMGAIRRRKLVRRRVFEALGGGEGSALNRLLLCISHPTNDSASCVFLLAFSPPIKPPSLNELDYRWYLIHQPGNCCARCCFWNSPLLFDRLNLQDVVAHQIDLLALKNEKKSSESTRCIPCGAVPCLVTSGLFVWRLGGSIPSVDTPQCLSHVKSSPRRPWSVLYLGPDNEIDDEAQSVSPAVFLASSSSSAPYCCYCSSPLPQSRCRSRVQQHHHSQRHQHHHQKHSNYHAYANLACGVGSSTLPGVSRLTHHRHTSPVVFPRKPSFNVRDAPYDPNRRGVFYSPSTSCSTSQASSPSSPQSHASYCNTSGGAVGPTCLSPNPLKYSSHEGGTYVNLEHLSTSVYRQQTRWLAARGFRPFASAVTDRIPDEIREPKRNYALVDLRPSPASSVVAPGDTITLVSTSEDVNAVTSDNCGGGGSGSRTDSSASTLHTNTSTSSSAATCVAGSMSGSRPRTASQQRRTSSHSLTAVLPVPTLNYVHIMRKRHAEAGPTCAVGCESPAPSSTANSAVAISADEKRPSTMGSLNVRTTNTPVPTAEQIPYAEIDFERTRALNVVNGAGELGHLNGLHFHHFKHHKSAVNASSTSSGGKASIVGGCGGGRRSLHSRKKSDG